MLKKCRPHGLPDRNARNSSACAPRGNGRGHRPCHSAPLTPRPPGAQSPRPAPAPPPAGASRPPGRALASLGAGCTGLGDSVPRGRGKRMRFLVPPGLGAEDQSPNHQPCCHGRGHRPCHSAPPTPRLPGAKAPGQRPPRPRRALPARQVGRWPLLVRAARVLVAASRAGGGNAVRFPFPPGEGAEDQTPNHQARCNGRGYRPCHSVPLTPRPPGAQSPRPAPAPPLAGAGLPSVRVARVFVAVFRTGGGNACVSLSHPERARKIRLQTTNPAAMAGAIAPATAPR